MPMNLCQRRSLVVTFRRTAFVSKQWVEKISVGQSGHLNTVQTSCKNVCIKTWCCFFSLDFPWNVTKRKQIVRFLVVKRHKKKANREISCCEEYYSKKTESNCLKKILKLAECLLNYQFFHLNVRKTNAAIKGKDSQNRRLWMVQFWLLPYRWTTLGTSPVLRVLVVAVVKHF